MDGRQQDYSHHGGLSSPYAAQFSPNHSDPGSSDQASAQGHYQSHVKYEPDSARPGAYAEYITHAQAQAPRSYAEGQPRYQPQQPSAQPHAAMAQTSPSTSSSSYPPLVIPDGHASNASHNHSQHHADSNYSLDSSIAASSPTYPPHQQYSPYGPQHEMQPQYGPHGAYMPPRPDWAGHYGATPVYGQMAGPPPPGMAQVPRPPPGGHPLSTVYSFVPIPGSQQHKRPRRRFEEIERMYKCGWQGCEKAYGTLNHLNAHVTMQSHGPKRTPEEFKEIRKEWKAKKKEEEHARKQEEERQRAEGRPVGQEGTPTSATAQYAPSHMLAPGMGGPQLPPIGYAPAPGQAPAQYSAGPPVDGQAYQATSQMYTNGYPQSPYGQQSQMYQQRA
ncbi:hypothetical protein K461DRAFT_72972 [Myriangium duriaei CBS 260.36]|uniref:C2H2-type domain-containing protein n=1 Tax=Myriangium duriaei CBS 260.36 TaxID=1168546 RepID=A0A9P4IW40_9PEZI|nr:hypothetical protein K461DRAFT_72972 [Myriangium duriaei CBS 260.36]